MPKREFTPSSGNVFADLKLPRAEDLPAKAELAAKIIAEIDRRGLTQSEAAARLSYRGFCATRAASERSAFTRKYGVVHCLLPAKPSS